VTMLETDATRFTELVLLEETWNEECKCESTHADKDNRFCSGSVTHRGFISCSGESVNLCSNAAQAWKRWMLPGETECCYCSRPNNECRKVIPI